MATQTERDLEAIEDEALEALREVVKDDSQPQARVEAAVELLNWQRRAAEAQRRAGRR